MTTYRDRNGVEIQLRAASRDWEVLHYSTERESDGAIAGWCVLHRAKTYRAAATWANLERGTRIWRGPVRPLKVGDEVKQSDITAESIPAYKALRGTVLELRGSIALVKWTCDASPTLVNVAAITQADEP